MEPSKGKPVKQYLKAIIAAIAAVALIAFQSVQAIVQPGHTWSVYDTATIVLAVLLSAGTYFTANSPDAFGLDARAKAVVATVLAVLIVGVQAIQPFLTAGHVFTSTDAMTVIVAVLGALGVYAVPNTTLTLVPGAPTADGVPQDTTPTVVVAPVPTPGPAPEPALPAAA